MLLARTSAVTLSVLLCLASGVGPAAAASTEYAEWALTSKTEGTVAVPAVGFPEGTFTSNSSSLTVPSGTSTYLNESTPFGAEYGSSYGKQYLNFRAAAGGATSTTTITFDTPATAGDWGFALGDIDADKVKVTAIGADGKPLTAAQLGWKGAFNFCADAPRPSSCLRGRDYTDVPTWDPATSTLVGNTVDTFGASGWFQPTVAVKSLKLEFSVLTGIPIGHLWIAAKWSSAEPDIVITKTASPTKVKPGGTVTYTVKVTNEGTAPEPHAEFSDDLSDVIDDADYTGAKATGGTVTYAKPILTWEGPVDPGETQTVTYTATIHHHPNGNRKVLNAIIGEGPRMTCQDGKGPGCAVAVTIRKPKHDKSGKSGKFPRNACRVATAETNCQLKPGTPLPGR